MALVRKTSRVEVDIPPKKILFLGDENVGKTTFIREYCEYMRHHYRCDTYVGEYLVFTQFLLYLERFDKRVPIRLLDLPNGTTEESRRDQYPSEVNLIVLCYAIDDATSFLNIWLRWIPEFRRYYPDSTRFYLLALKNDMRVELLEANKIPITAERGRRIHQQYEFTGDYLDCSVKANPGQARHFMDILINDVIFHS